MLTAERLREVLHYDPLTGLFTRLVQTGGGLAGEIAGGMTFPSCYIMIRLDGVNYGAHRLALFYMNGVMPSKQVDHVDWCAWNNRFNNLRAVGRQVNSQNRGTPYRGNRSGFLGVSPLPNGGFRSQITVDARQRFLGHFPSPELAHAAYVNAKSDLHAGNTL